LVVWIELLRLQFSRIFSLSTEMKKDYRKNIVALNAYSRRAGEGRNEVLEQGLEIQASSRREFLVSELENVRVLLDQGLASNAQTRLASIMKAAQHEPSLLAQARCALSVALETQGRYRESLEIVSRYEFSESRTMLDQDTRVSVLVHAGLAIITLEINQKPSPY